MTKGRLEAFSDGVIAIIITIMVLELHPPHVPELAALAPLWPAFGSYVLSFIYVGIYWNNHHHLLHATDRVSGLALWANLHLLFWLSLTPFVSAWMGENHFAALPMALYGFVLMMAGVAYYLFTRSLLSEHGENSALARAVGNDFKGKISVVMYAVAIGVAFVLPAAAFAVYVAVALMWLVPDRRIERELEKEPRRA